MSVAALADFGKVRNGAVPTERAGSSIKCKAKDSSVVTENFQSDCTTPISMYKVTGETVACEEFRKEVTPPEVTGTFIMCGGDEITAWDVHPVGRMVRCLFLSSVVYTWFCYMTYVSDLCVVCACLTADCPIHRALTAI